MRTVGVLGAGSWGTALAVHLSRTGHEVRLWARDESLVADMRARRANAVYLPDVTLPDGVIVTHALDRALSGADLVVAAVPSHGCRAVMHSAAGYLHPHAVVVSATKGLEGESLLRMSEVIAREIDPSHPIVALSGPSFALEVAHSLPTAVVAASADPAAAALVQAEFRGPYFRLYGSDDVVGVEIGGALKNVIAIAAGVVEGLGLGHNALAALDHPRPRGDRAAGLRARRPARDAGRVERPRRSRADLHGESQPEPARRYRARARPSARRRFWPA